MKQNKKMEIYNDIFHRLNEFIIQKNQDKNNDECILNIVALALEPVMFNEAHNMQNGKLIFSSAYFFVHFSFSRDSNAWRTSLLCCQHRAIVTWYQTQRGAEKKQMPALLCIVAANCNAARPPANEFNRSKLEICHTFRTGFMSSVVPQTATGTWHIRNVMALILHLFIIIIIIIVCMLVRPSSLPQRRVERITQAQNWMMLTGRYVFVRLSCFVACAMEDEAGGSWRLK